MRRDHAAGRGGRQAEAARDAARAAAPYEARGGRRRMGGGGEACREGGAARPEGVLVCAVQTAISGDDRRTGNTESVCAFDEAHEAARGVCAAAWRVYRFVLPFDVQVCGRCAGFPRLGRHRRRPRASRRAVCGFARAGSRRFHCTTRAPAAPFAEASAAGRLVPGGARAPPPAHSPAHFDVALGLRVVRSAQCAARGNGGAPQQCEVRCICGR
mmetsp:Transcript_14758/g.39545  ORF Transcript_14758/g.39545 Transcript_14758/m.39545 type:complete len:214 (+) Transcript_14758:96-737(+)